MPQFANTSPQPIDPNQYRQRLQGLVNQRASASQVSNSPNTEPVPIVRSRVAAMTANLTPPASKPVVASFTSSPTTTSVPLTQPIGERQPVAPNVAKPLTTPPVAVSSVPPVQPVPSRSAEVHLPLAGQPKSSIGTPVTKESKPVKPAPVSMPTKEPEKTIAESADAVSKSKITAKPGTVEYWHALWQQHVKADRVIDPTREKIILEVQMPQDNEIEPVAGEQMFGSLFGLGKRPGVVFTKLVALFPVTEIMFKNPDDALSFEMVADEKSVRFLVVTPKEWRDYVERQIHGAFQEAEIKPVKLDTFMPETGQAAFAQITTKGKVFYPIRVLEDFETDPLSSLLSGLSKLEAGERVILQFLLQPADDSWRKRGQMFVQLAQSPPKSDKEKRVHVDQSILEGVGKKIVKPGFRLVARLLVVATDSFKADSILANIVGSFDQYSLPHLAIFDDKKQNPNAGIVASFVTRSFPRWGNYPILNTMELASIYHFPNNKIQTPRINWLRARKSAPPTNMPTEGLYLGKSEYRDTEVEVRIKREDRRRHMYILGQTGTGKTEFMKHLIWQDMVNGDGLAFIDPHGEGVEDILQMVPKERAEDVIYFNPADTERPMGLNILDAKTEGQQHMAVNSFIGLLYKLYDPNHQGIVGPQLERAVRNVMLTAMSEEGNTMIEVLRLLTNPKFAEKKIPLIKDPMVKTYWTEQLAQTNEFHKSETLGYFVSKFDRFVTEKLMRNTIGQGQSAINFREIMDNKKILLVNLSKGRLGEENSNFLGLLLIPRILAAAMSRADMANEDRKDFFLYVDEFQNFATPDFAQILAEARKYRLNLTVANQFIAQIQEDIRNAVFGNVGTSVIFRVGADDGEYMEKQFEPVFKQGDLINQAMGEASLKLLIDGQPSRPFSFRSDWNQIKNIPKNPKLAEVIKGLSRIKYGRERSIVEREIAVRAGLE